MIMMMMMMSLCLAADVNEIFFFPWRDPHFSALQALAFPSENANRVCSTFCDSVPSAAGKPWVI